MGIRSLYVPEAYGSWEFLTSQELKGIVVFYFTEIDLDWCTRQSFLPRVNENSSFFIPEAYGNKRLGFPGGNGSR